MNKNISNYDKNDNLHGEQIIYYSNDNICRITNFHHARLNGYDGYFHPDNSIGYKLYCNMDKWVYIESHYHKQIQIRI